MKAVYFFFWLNPLAGVTVHMMRTRRRPWHFNEVIISTEFCVYDHEQIVSWCAHTGLPHAKISVDQ
jgi:hypothetical protein